MTRDEKEEYVVRISSATPAQLVVINYEIAMTYMSEAASAHAEGDREQFKRCVDKATDSILVLRDSLHFTNDIATELFLLYVYSERLLIEAKNSCSIEPVLEVRKILLELSEGWRIAAAKESGASPVMDSSQSVYAGLTYTGAELDEYVVERKNSGYEA